MTGFGCLHQGLAFLNEPLPQPSPGPAGRITAAHTPPLAAPTPPLQIRPYEPVDWPKVWALLEPVFRAGETFPHDPAITEDEARAAWVKQSSAVMVAADAAGSLVGTFYLRSNSLALGAHVANAVSASTPCRRRGGWASG